MSSYTAVQWLFFFYFYCFFGWCFESTYVSLKKRKLVNRGFIRGPFLPLYGSGAIMMLLISIPFQGRLVLMFFAGFVGATALEYVTGVVMEALFKVRYWDYSNKKFNFQGHICLSSSIAWGVLTILVTNGLHKPIERWVLSIPTQILTILTLILTAYICADFAVSFKTAWDIRDMLYKMEKVKTEMLRMQKRLDVMIAMTSEELSDRVEEHGERIAQKRDEWKENVNFRMEDVKSGVEQKMERAVEHLASLKPELSAEKSMEILKKELMEMRIRYNRLVERQNSLSRARDWLQSNMVRSNPTMSSRYFKEAFEEFRKNLTEKIEDDRDEL